MKVFFISETYRADTQTWLKGLRDYGHCAVETWELKKRTGPFARIQRMADWLWACFFLGRKIKRSGADILLAERVTSYGFIGACTGVHPFVVAQQGITDVWPQNSMSTPFKAMLARYALKKADMIQAWGDVMVPAMLELGADPGKIRVMAKGIDIARFNFQQEDKKWDKIHAIVTRSLTPDYRHEMIIKAARILKDRGIPAEIVLVGDGPLMEQLKALSKELKIEDSIIFKGQIPNDQLPTLLRQANMYVSVPITEGVSASLFEAMGSGAFPVVTDLPGAAAFITNEVNGYLVPVDEPAALAAAMIKAWQNQPFMQQVITANRALVEDKGNFHKNMPVFVEWYEGIVGEN